MKFEYCVRLLLYTIYIKKYCCRVLQRVKIVLFIQGIVLKREVYCFFACRGDLCTMHCYYSLVLIIISIYSIWLVQKKDTTLKLTLLLFIISCIYYYIYHTEVFLKNTFSPTPYSFVLFVFIYLLKDICTIRWFFFKEDI